MTHFVTVNKSYLRMEKSERWEIGIIWSLGCTAWKIFFRAVLEIAYLYPPACTHIHKIRILKKQGESPWVYSKPRRRKDSSKEGAKSSSTGCDGSLSPYKGMFQPKALFSSCSGVNKPLTTAFPNTYLSLTSCVGQVIEPCWVVPSSVKEEVVIIMTVGIHTL